MGFESVAHLDLVLIAAEVHEIYLHYTHVAAAVCRDLDFGFLTFGNLHNVHVLHTHVVRSVVLIQHTTRGIDSGGKGMLSFCRSPGCCEFYDTVTVGTETLFVCHAVD